MPKEADYALKSLKKAFARMQEGLQMADSALSRDGVVQRFEFTFELLWKALKVFLEEKGIIVTTPKECLQQAFRLGWIQDDLIFVAMLEARNRMSHEYDESEAMKVFKEVRKRFIKPIRALIAHLDAERKRASKKK